MLLAHSYESDYIDTKAEFVEEITWIFHIPRLTQADSCKYFVF